MSVGALLQTPLGKFTALPRSPSWFQGGASRQEGNGGEGRERPRGGKRGKGNGKGEMGRERGNGKGGEKGKLGDSALIVGG